LFTSSLLVHRIKVDSIFFFLWVCLQSNEPVLAHQGLTFLPNQQQVPELTLQAALEQLQQQAQQLLMHQQKTQQLQAQVQQAYGCIAQLAAQLEQQQKICKQLLSQLASQPAQAPPLIPTHQKPSTQDGVFTSCSSIVGSSNSNFLTGLAEPKLNWKLAPTLSLSQVPCSLLGLTRRGSGMGSMLAQSSDGPHIFAFSQDLGPFAGLAGDSDNAKASGLRSINSNVSDLVAVGTSTTPLSKHGSSTGSDSMLSRLSSLVAPVPFPPTPFTPSHTQIHTQQQKLTELKELYARQREQQLQLQQIAALRCALAFSGHQ